MAIQEGSSPGQGADRGVLIGEDGTTVDLFIVDTEEVELSNEISGDNRQGDTEATTSIRPLATTIRVEGVLSQATHGNPYKSTEKKPVEKISNLIKMTNQQGDSVKTCKLVAPSLPFTYLSFFPKTFSYRSNKSTNTVGYTLVLTEVNLDQPLTDRGGQGSPLGGEDKGLIESAGQTALNALGNKVGLDDVGDTIAENDGNLIDTAKDVLTDKDTITGIAGTVGGMLGGPVGSVIGKGLAGLAFGDASTLKNFAKRQAREAINNIPVVGGAINSMLGLPGDTEMVVTMRRNGYEALMFTMRSPLMQKLRKSVMTKGLEEIDAPAGMKQKILNKKIYNAEQTRISANAWQIGVEKTGINDMSQKALQEWLNKQPSALGADSITFYSGLGQPLVTFDGILEIPSRNWQRRSVELNGNIYDFEVYWNNAGFPVISIEKPDGSPVTKEQKITMGSDILGKVQGMSELEGMHIIPVSFTNNKMITKGNFGKGVYLMVVYTNKHAINKVI